MLDTTTDLHVTAANLTAEGRQLKIEGRKAIGKARKKLHSQNPDGVALAYHRFNNIYRERMVVRYTSRLVHLTRMLLKGKAYHEVEHKTHEKVDADDLYDTVWEYDPTVTSELVHAWLEPMS